ncbi:LpqB family beta-propeller domain-containing protein [Cellulomonas aerilata]|uniref:Lipoprotein LpqB n=1 Tax=Cellulomonas aerilata TaxID=515326 RepID=A0A512DDA7_9CELL|nr:LpqB family beta-propeller domain-containing protein [Cellulomonas aerilata]GEO34417.1 lipoprotein LpqB [Cellulomonas aerilata]
MSAAPARLRRRLAVVAVWAVTVLVAGCVSIPTAGPVAEGDGTVDEPGSVFPLAYSPPTDASPTAIVQGFLSASAAGLGDSYAVARQYLTAPARTSWAPGEGVAVYSTAENLEFDDSRDSQVSVTFPMVATLDADGRYAESPPNAEQDAVFDLVQDAQGQWRITALDNGVLLSQPIFDSVYRATPLYFLGPTADVLVPEVRWFPERNTATYAVRALLQGPSPWLRDAVRTAFPEGTALALESVPVGADGTATVDLSAAVAAAGTDDRALMKAQLAEVLELPGIRDVAVSIAGLPMVEPEPAELRRDPSPGTVARMIRDGQVLQLDGDEPTFAADVAPLAVPDPHGLAWARDGGPTVLLSGADTLVLAPAPGGAPRALVQGPALVAPSVDPASWVWTGPSQSAGRLTAVQVDGPVVDVGAEWLDGRVVRSLRVSRDGARVAIVSAGPDGVTVDVAGVVRDGSGTPQRLTERMRVGARLLTATQVAWLDESTLAVLGTSGTMTGPTVHLVPTAGPTRPLPAIDGAVSLAAGRGERALYVATDAGVLLTLRGTSWVEVVTGVQSPAFPG